MYTVLYLTMLSHVLFYCCGQQIQELMEAIVLPMTHKERFDNLGIRPPKGVLLYGPPGTGKTLMARACAAQTNATYLKLAGPQLVQVISCDCFPAFNDDSGLVAHC
jgi:Holliday junction resolvasome RuvABC ATP-dependent DNA helicase subunit